MAFVIASQPGVGDASDTSWDMGMGPALGRFIAVELDMRYDEQLHDPNDNHVGLNVNGMNASVATGIPAFSMASEVPFSVWVDFDGATGSLRVYTAQNSSIKPDSPTLSTTLDIAAALLPANPLTGYFMGFTSSTGWSSSEYIVLSWCLAAGQCIVQHSCCSNVHQLPDDVDRHAQYCPFVSRDSRWPFDASLFGIMAGQHPEC